MLDSMIEVSKGAVIEKLSDVIRWMLNRDFKIEICIDRMRATESGVYDFLTDLGNSENLTLRSMPREFSANMHKKILITPIAAMSGSANLTNYGADFSQENISHTMRSNRTQYDSLKGSARTTFSQAEIIDLDNISPARRSARTSGTGRLETQLTPIEKLAQEFSNGEMLGRERLNLEFKPAFLRTSRTIEVHDGKMNEFIKMAGKKTKMFNNNGEGPAYSTFEILSGANSGKIFRVQIASPEQMDGELATKDELQYWEKNVVPLIKDNDSSRTIMWVRSAETSFVPEIATDNDLRQVLFYNYKTSHEQDFWRFRQRQAKAWAAMESPSDSAMNVMVCQSGCNGNVVAIFFSYENYQGQNEVESEGLPKMVEKYNELFVQIIH